MFAFFIFFLCGMFLCGCQRHEPQKTDQQIQLDAASVCIIYDRNAVLTKATIAESVGKMLAERGIKADIRDLTGKRSEYVEAIDDALKKGSTGLAVALQYDLKTDERLEEALTKGVKVLQLCGGYYNSTISFSVNEYDIGYDMGRMVAEKLKESQTKPRITLITAKELRNAEKGFEDGLRELLPEAVIRYKIVVSSEEQVNPDFISSRYFSDGMVVFFCDNVKMPSFRQKPLVFYTGLSKEAFDADNKLILTEGESLKKAVDQFINALYDKRVDERGFYYESSLQ